MEITYEWTDGGNADFLRFYVKTEDFYSSIVGGKKNRAAFIPYNVSASISHVLNAYVSAAAVGCEDLRAAVGCAGLKAYSETDVEIKRVWVDPEFRGHHIAENMMGQLEAKARELGFKRAILQTRPQMEAAVALYEKLGYSLIDNYPPYDKLDGAICYAKVL